VETAGAVRAPTRGPESCGLSDPHGPFLKIGTKTARPLAVFVSRIRGDAGQNRGSTGGPSSQKSIWYVVSVSWTGQEPWCSLRFRESVAEVLTDPWLLREQSEKGRAELPRTHWAPASGCPRPWGQCGEGLAQRDGSSTTHSQDALRASGTEAPSLGERRLLQHQAEAPRLGEAQRMPSQKNLLLI